MPAGIRALIEGLLNPDPKSRFGLRELLLQPCISHELLQSVAAEQPLLQGDMEELMVGALGNARVFPDALRLDGKESGKGQVLLQSILS